MPSNHKQIYRDKPSSYFGAVRQDVLRLLPDETERILEIGCGSGDTLEYLKNTGRCRWVGGVELVETPAAGAVNRGLDFFLSGNVEEVDIDLPNSSIDAVLCLDVLEHLVDPWSTVQRLTGLLKPDGALIASIPNVRFYKVVFPLLFKGRWRYVESGVLDATHLRFFTRESCVTLLQQAGLTVDAIENGMPANKGRARTNRITGGLFEGLLAERYILRGRKVEATEAGSRGP